MKNDSDIQTLKKRLQEKGLSDSFCLMPFTTLNLQPDGTVSVCRHKGTDFVVGSLKENSLAEIWNGPKLQAWREEFLSGNIKTCKWEIENLSCHQCSLINSLWDKAQLETQVDTILRFGANLNGLCNLQCRMCNVWTQESGLYDKRNYWPLMKKNLLPYLEVIELFSGEPFLQQDTFRLSQTMAEVNPSCRWFITTNGQFDVSEEVSQFLTNTNIHHLYFSLDTLDPEQYQAIRRGGELERTLQTMEEICQFYKDHPELKRPTIGINFLMMKDNYEQIPIVQSYANQLGVEFSLGVLQRPKQFSLMEQSLEVRLKALDFLFNYSKNTENLSHRVITSLLHSLPIAERKAFLFKNAAK